MQIALVCLHFLCTSFVFVFQLVGQFIARAVSDQILSKSYIEGYKGRVDCEYTRCVIVCCAARGFSFLFNTVVNTLEIISGL